MIARFDEGQRMSLAVAYGPFFETAGIVADDPALDVVGQARQALATIESLMARAGFTRNDLTRVQIWIADYAFFEQVNTVYDAWVDGFGKPVRACVESGLGGYLIEIQVFAFRSSILS
ncbi:RidA family protein [Pseudomonas sp. CR3202]|uniref:RidA family protein n=1 Tax=Pseudomonas sp. CR3202 TaxID=3351532 RepID=UPI003BF17670